MRFIQNIFLVSYIKNKGIRRVCFVLSAGLLLYLLFTLVVDGRFKGVDQRYNSFYELNSDVYSAWEYKHKDWHKKIECTSVYLKQYGFSGLEVWSLTSERDIANNNSKWCYAYSDLCEKIKKIKNKPIHLKCGAFETSEHSNTKGFLIFTLLLVVLAYLPFIFCVVIKVIYKLIKTTIIWIYQGFKESSNA